MILRLALQISISTKVEETENTAVAEFWRPFSSVLFVLPCPLRQKGKAPHHAQGEGSRALEAYI